MKLSEFISKYGDCEVTEEMEKFIEKPKWKWKPRYGEEYWLINSAGLIVRSTWVDCVNDDYRYNFLRIFKNSEEAERYCEIMSACKEASFEPDWDDKKQNKYYLIYDHGEHEVNVNVACYYNHGNMFYFESPKIARELIDHFGEKDIAKYVLGVEVE